MKKQVRWVMFAASLLFLFPAVLRAELTVGEKAPDFTLTDINGKTHSLSEAAGKFVVLEWTNYECPFVVKHYGSGNMQGLQKTYTEKGVAWFSINSSAEGKQGNFTPEKWKDALDQQKAVPTATLLDGDGKVGKAYGAQTTPHIFIVNPEGNLIYQGAIDSKASADPQDIAGAKNYVKAALDEALAGKPVSEASTKAYGCSVKY